MAVTIDARPSYFGDRMIVTGSYGAGDTSINLTGLLAIIDMAEVTPTVAISPIVIDSAPYTFGEFATVGGTTITVNTPGGAQATVGGTFLAIGRRS